MSIEKDLIKAAKSRHKCWIIDKENNKRFIEPYMIFTSSKGNRLFHCFQIKGYSSRKKETEWKCPKLADYSIIRETDEKFEIRKDYNPFNMDMFPIVHFSLPNAKGENRENS